MIKANKGSCFHNLITKLVLNYTICLIIFLIMILSGSLYMKARGVQIIVEAVVIPLLMSFICFILNGTVVFLLCMFFNNIITKMMYSVLGLILVLVVSQTEYSTYIPFTYASSIALDYENCGWKIGICAILSVLIGYLGVRILNIHKGQ